MKDSSYELVLSCVVGLILSVVVIKFGSQRSNKTIVKKDDDHKDNKDKVELVLNDDSQDYKVATINEAKFLEKSEKLQQMLGISKEDVHQAIIETNIKINANKDADGHQDNEISWFGLIDTFVFILFLGAAFFALNSFSHGEFGRILLGLFPKELSALKLTRYLEQHHIHGETAIDNSK